MLSTKFHEPQSNLTQIKPSIPSSHNLV